MTGGNHLCSKGTNYRGHRTRRLHGIPVELPYWRTVIFLIIRAYLAVVLLYMAETSGDLEIKSVRKLELVLLKRVLWLTGISSC